MMSLSANNVSRQVFVSCVLWSLVTASVSVWWESVLGVNLSGRESRLEPDSTLFVMQILGSLTANLLSLVGVILVGLRYRLFVICRLGFGV